MKVPLVDLKAQYNSIKQEIDGATQRVIETAQFILGPETEALENELAAYIGSKYALGVASGTDALHLALLACGVGPGDEVITTPFTFISTAETITHCGATPVFVDIDPETYNIDPVKIESAMTDKTRAILPVHLYGQPADMNPILELAGKYDLKIIEDCAQALGAEHNGKKVGSLGEVSCFSFFPSKVLGAYGDGGMILTDSPEITEKVKILRNHGTREKYYHVIPGFNSRLDSLQAAILRVKLRHANEWIDQRRQRAQFYSQLLSSIEGIEPPSIAPEGYHVFNYYTIRLRNIRREKLREFLTFQGITTAIYYPLSLHLQKAFKPLGYKLGDFPESEAAQEEVLSLPIYPELSEGQIEKIVAAVRDYCRGQG